MLANIPFVFFPTLFNWFKVPFNNFILSSSLPILAFAFSNSVKSLITVKRLLFILSFSIALANRSNLTITLSKSFILNILPTNAYIACVNDEKLTLIFCNFTAVFTSLFIAKPNEDI